MSLYETELALRGNGTQTQGFDLLFRTVSGPRALLALAAPRWQALLGRGDWQAVREDLRELKQRVKPIDPITWMRLIFLAADHLAWGRDYRPEYDLCLHEAEDHEHLAHELAREYDRFDYLRRLANGCQKARGEPAELLRLIEWSWSRPFPDVRGMLDGVLAAIDFDPMAWLHDLDLLSPIAPLALHWFGQLLESRSADVHWQDDVDRDKLNRLVRPALKRLDSQSYQRARKDFLAFCVKEGLDPVTVADAVVGITTKSQGKFVALRETLADDMPVRLVGKAILIARS